MTKTIITSIGLEETRMAQLENGVLIETAMERCTSTQTAGNIYKGRIKNMLPGMQAAFVDIGREKNAFLYIGKTYPYIGGLTDPGVPLTEGQEIIVQVSKDAIGAKGPRVVTEWNLPGRYLVLMPTANHIGVSRRIETEEERERLQLAAQEICPAGMGLIVRTVAEGKTVDDLRKDVNYLYNLSAALVARAKRSSAPILLYRDVDLIIRLVRDTFDDSVDEFIIDQQEAYNRVRDLVKISDPDLFSRIHLYQSDKDVFVHYGVEIQLEDLRQREVRLNCGGYLVIDRTEALTVIDVNTGKFVGNTNLATTVFQTNCEAAKEIARQIRLRDIGGMILIDFIDMNQEEHRQAILSLLEEHLHKDRTRTNVYGFTALGLVEMTRKKVRQDMDTTMYEACSFCEGRGRLLSPETMVIRINRQLRRIAAGQRTSGSFLLQAPSRLTSALSPEWLSNAERDLSLSLQLEFRTDLQPEVFTILRSKG
ncbi:MAG: ribonuclease, Rne/Rng family [Firmicutes bacterium]|nr:ribonuclease, Rne/Rng family [Bacillota bacterium]